MTQNNSSLRTRTVTQAYFIAALMATAGATPITFTAVTEPKMRKTNNPYLGVVKQSRVNGMLNFHYDDGVLRRLAKEGKSADEFKQGTSWHEPVMNGDKLTPLCKHKQNGNFYLRFMHQKTIETRYFLNGNEISEDKLKPFLQESKSYANQGLDEPLVFLTYGINGIVEASFLGERFVIHG